MSVCLFSVGVLGEVFYSDCETVKSQPFFSFSRKRQAHHMESPEDFNAASSPEDVPPLPRRRTQEVDCAVNPKMGSGLPSGCQKHAELFGQQ